MSPRLYDWLNDAYRNIKINGKRLNDELDNVFRGGGTLDRITILSNGNIGFGKETNPQTGIFGNNNFVFSNNATTGLSNFNSEGVLLFGPDSGGLTAPGFNVFNFGNVAINTMNRIDGTAAIPSNLGASESIGAFGFGGWGNGAFQGARIRLLAVTTEAWNTTFGTYFEIDATPTGGTRTQAMRVQGGVIIGTGTTDPGNGATLLTPVTVATLPAASSSLKGAIASVSDGTAALAWGATVTGGGATPYLVYCNGTNWTVAGK